MAGRMSDILNDASKQLRNLIESAEDYDKKLDDLLHKMLSSGDKQVQTAVRIFKAYRDIYAINAEFYQQEDDILRLSNEYLSNLENIAKEKKKGQSLDDRDYERAIRNKKTQEKLLEVIRDINKEEGKGLTKKEKAETLKVLKNTVAALDDVKKKEQEVTKAGKGKSSKGAIGIDANSLNDLTKSLTTLVKVVTELATAFAAVKSNAASATTETSKIGKAGKKAQTDIAESAKSGTGKKSNKRIADTVFTKEDSLKIVNNLNAVKTAIDEMYSSWKKVGESSDVKGGFQVSFVNENVNKFFNEFGKALKMYEKAVKSKGGVASIGKRSDANNFLVDALFGPYSERNKALTNSVRESVKVVDNVIKTERESGRRRLEFSKSDLSANERVKEIGDFLKKEGAKQELESWDQLDEKVKKVIASLYELKRIDNIYAAVAPGEYLRKSKDIAKEITRNHAGRFSGSVVARAADKYPFDPLRVAEAKDAARHRLGASDRKYSLDEKDAERKNKVLDDQFKEVVKTLTTALTELKTSINSLKEGLTNNDSKYQLHIGNEGAEYFFRAMKEIFEPYFRKDDEKPHSRMSRNGSNPLRDDYVLFRREVLGADGKGKKGISRIPIPLDVLDSEALKTGKGSILETGLSNKIRDAVKNGIEEGIREGIKAGFSKDVQFAKLAGVSDALLGGAKPSSNRAKYAASVMNESLMMSESGRLKKARIESKSNIEKTRIAEEEKTKREKEKTLQKRAAESERLERLKIEDEQAYQKELHATSRIYELEIQKRERIEKEAEENRLAKEEKFRRQRERWEQDELNFVTALEQYRGKDASTIEQIGIRLREQREEYLRIYEQAMLNKGNNDAHLRSLRKLKALTREIYVETEKEYNGYNKLIRATEKWHKILVAASAIFQRMSSSIGSITSIFTTIRSQTHALFGHLRNGFTSITSRLRSQLTTAIQAGVEQFDKLEQAKISFESFYGDQADAVLSQVRSKALASPLATAGDLAEYVAQLAPVSNENPQLAIDAALGALKTLKYSGTDASEMEYVIKNIRDVVAKGKATAIDMRQFSRALPAMQKALQTIGGSEFLKDGELNITPKNAKKILEMFAQLNNDENSPLANIDERILNTTAGLKQRFTELRAAAVEDIYRDSGIADLIKSLYKTGNDVAIWKRLTDFLSENLKKAVEFIKSVNWEELGKRFSEGFKVITDSLKTAITTILGSAGIDASSGLTGIVNSLIENKGLFDKVWEIIGSFITNFGNGLSQTIELIKKITNNVDPDLLKNLAGIMGYLASPMGKIITLGGNMLRDALNGLSRMTSLVDSGVNVFSNFRQKMLLSKAGKTADLLGGLGMAVGSKEYQAKYGKIGLQKTADGKPLAAMLTQSTLRAIKQPLYSDLELTAEEKLSGGRVISRSYLKKVEQENKFVLRALKDDEVKNKKLLKLRKTIQNKVPGKFGNILSAPFTEFGSNYKKHNDVILEDAKFWYKDGKRRGFLDYNKQKKIGKGVYEPLTWNSDSMMDPKNGKTFKELSFRNKVMNVGFGNTMQYYGMKATEFAKEFAEKAVSALAISQLAKGITSVASTLISRVNPALGKFAESAGNVASDMIGWGSQFGIKGALIAGLISSIQQVTNAQKELDEAARQAAASMREANRSSMAQNVYDSVLQNLKDLGWYQEDDLQSEDAWNKVVKELDGMSASELSDPNVISRLMQVYTHRRGQSGAAEVIEEDLDSLTKGVTKLSEKDTGTLKQIALYLQKYGYVNDLDEDKIKRLDEGGYRSYAGYLEKNNSLPGSVEAAEDLLNRLKEADGVYNEWDKKHKDKKSTYQLYVQDGDKMVPFAKITDNDAMKRWMENNGFIYIESTKSYQARATIMVEEPKGAFGSYTKEQYQVQKTGKGGEGSWMVRETSGNHNVVEVYGHSDMNKYIKQVAKDIYGFDMDAPMSSLFTNTNQDLINWLLKSFDTKTLKKILNSEERRKLSFPFNSGGFVPVYRAHGGATRGVDTVPAMLQPGEFVMRRASVAKAGMDVMSALNRGDLGYASRLLGTRFNNSWNNSRNWSNVVNNNQRSSRNNVTIINRNASQRVNSYMSLANRIALA